MCRFDYRQPNVSHSLQTYNRATMKLLFDLLPVILFFAAFKLYNVFVATAVVIAATFAQIAWVWYRHRKVDTMLWVSLALVVVFGGATLILHDELFIKWKPTVLYAGMAIALAIAIWGMKNNFLKSILGTHLELPDAVWHKLNVAWVAYTAFMSISNAYVVMYYSEDAWANFKIWGYVFPLAFLIGQGIFIAPHLKADNPTDNKPSP